ncbi:MAG TPA: FAD-dependent oxidoreductase [Acidobacteriaceae bacterium]|nr:FAD-dependent oxidoreductase [Acidobacteriaceae bacterium]
MEIDLAQLDSSAAGSDLLRAPICIIGGGIAGLTLAHKLVTLGHEVLLLESGGDTREDVSAVGQAGDSHPGTTEPRPRALGGTSLTWGGQLLPFPHDNSSWPISASDLASFTSEAEHLLAVDSLPYDASAFFAQTRQPEPSLLNQLPHIEGSLSKFTPFSHRNLAHTLGRKLRAHSKARIALHATVTELLLAPTRDRIEAVLVRTPSGHTHRVQAQHFILAAGTIETVRLLLASQSIANQHDQLGRNFHDHLTITAATLHEPARTQLLTAARPWIYRRKPYGSTLHTLKLSASPELQRQLNLTPILAHLTIDEPDASGIGALRSLLRARQQSTLAPTLRSTLPQLPRALADATRLTLSARTHHRRYVSPQASVELRLNAAQRTPSASRITISPDLKPILDWRIDATELATLRAFTQHLRTHLNLDGLAWNPALLTRERNAPIPALDDARHAMGGASMGIDPHASVVDPDLRIHGLRNLFIASAAVFPDGSPQLPTLPLMALTLRLAQHLHSLSSG